MPRISPDVTRVCKICGKEYHPKSSRQQSCNLPIKKRCVVCGGEFDSICTISDTKITCSVECQAEYIKQKRKKSASTLRKICKWCGKEFVPESVRDSYCKDIHYQTCQVCGKQFVIDVRKDTSVKTCSDVCRYKLATANKDMEAMVANLQATMQERYGVSNPMQVPETVEKLKKTNQERYGVDWYAQIDECKQRVEQTDLAMYGVRHHLSSPEVIAKRVSTLQKSRSVVVETNEDTTHCPE